MHAKNLWQKMNLCTVYKLTVCSFVLGSVSVGLLALAISTDSWLLTRESWVPKDEEIQNVTVTWFRMWTGLWRYCMEIEDFPDSVACTAISWEVSSTGRGEQMATTTQTIIAAARGTVVLPVSALIFSLVAVIFSVVGNIRHNGNTLVGGVLFILAGLSLAVGLILYISAINDEVGYRSSTSKEEGGFSYTYGWSFYAAGFGFLASECAAVVTITLFLRRNQRLEDMARIIPGLEDKVVLAQRDHDMCPCGQPEVDECDLCCCGPGQECGEGGRIVGKSWSGLCRVSECRGDYMATTSGGGGCSSSGGAVGGVSIEEVAGCSSGHNGLNRGGDTKDSSMFGAGQSASVFA